MTARGGGAGRGGERERCGERGGPGGQGRDPALQGPEGAQAGDQQQRAGYRADRRDLFGEVVFAGGVDGQVQAEAERCSPVYRAMTPCSGPVPLQNPSQGV
jgi:hypothetical protein